MEIQRSFVVQAPLESTWDVLAGQFHDVGSWASMIHESKATAAISGTCGVQDRVCDTTDGVFKERVTEMDHEKKTLAYSVYEGMPGFVREGGNRWWLESEGPSETRISFRMKFELNPIAGALMGWMMKRQMSKTADQVCDDLKTYIETGKTSTAKQAAVAKRAA